MTSTYDDEPPKNALAFEEWIKQLLEHEMAVPEASEKKDTSSPSAEVASGGSLRSRPFRGIKYAVVGVGNSKWPTYQSVPKRFDDSLQKLGGLRIVHRGEIDVEVDCEEALQAWKKKWLQAILAEFVGAAEEGFVFDVI